MPVSENLRNASLSTPPKAEVERPFRAARISLDAVCLALFVYGAFYWRDGAIHVFLFFLMSVGVLPHPSVAAQLRRRPELHWVSLAFGLGLVVLGLVRGKVGPELFNGTVLLGVTLAIASWGNVLYVRTPADAKTSVLRLLLGVATLASGAAWLCSRFR